MNVAASERVVGKEDAMEWRGVDDAGGDELGKGALHAGDRFVAGAPPGDEFTEK